jgi:hypothetical protein
MLNPNALITLQAAKSYLKSYDGDDSALEELINGASSAIESHCKRNFKEQVYSNEEYDGKGTRYILLKQYPVKTITSIYVDDILLPTSDYKVKKDNGMLVRTNSIWPYGDINVLVSYTAGYPEIPADLELACKHLVMSYFKSDIASFSTTFQDGFVFRAEAFPTQVKALLAPYKKVM